MVSNGKKYKIKKWHFYLIGFVVAFSFVLKGYYYYWPKTNILINGTIQEVLLADNYRRWNVGLSKRKSMNKYPGMIFVFPNRDRHVMVMRDMNFSLDMLWIDSGKVVEIIENIQPEPGVAESQLKQFFSVTPADMVLELKSEYVKNNNIKIGDNIILLN